MKRIITYLGAVIVLVAVLAVAAAAYFRIGWDQMESACMTDDQPSVSYAWSFPDGFTCEFEDGSRRTSLLWF